jgi:hypothetical protein
VKIAGVPPPKIPPSDTPGCKGKYCLRFLTKRSRSFNAKIKKLSYHYCLKKKAMKLNSATFDEPYKYCKNQVTKQIRSSKTHYHQTKVENRKNRKETNASMFGDDTDISTSDTSLSEIANKINNDLSNVNTWLIQVNT